jgi:tetratricopeptide (TPR) repeat protein
VRQVGRAVSVFDSLYESASTLFIKGEYDAASKFVKEALSMRPDNCEALRLAAPTMAGLDDYQAAMDYIDRAISIQPDDADLHDAKAGILIGANSFADAEVEARTALGIAKMDDRMPLIDGLDFIYLTLVDALANQGKMEEAQKVLDEGRVLTKSDLLESVGK